MGFAAIFVPLIAKALERPDPAIYQSPTESVALTATLGITEITHQSALATTSIQDMVSSAFPDAPVMLRIARAESHLIPTAKNPHSTATGLFQVLNGTAKAYGCGIQTDPEQSIECARKIYDAEGTTPWNSSKANWL